jgi:hypothetical protein
MVLRTLDSCVFMGYRAKAVVIVLRTLDICVFMGYRAKAVVVVLRTLDICVLNTSLLEWVEFT